MGSGAPSTHSVDDPLLAKWRASSPRGVSNPGTDQFQAIDTPPPPPDLTDDAVRRAKQAQLLQGMSMTGYQSTFITGGK